MALKLDLTPTLAPTVHGCRTSIVRTKIASPDPDHDINLPGQAMAKHNEKKANDAEELLLTLERHCRLVIITRLLLPIHTHDPEDTGSSHTMRRIAIGDLHTRCGG